MNLNELLKAETPVKIRTPNFLKTNEVLKIVSKLIEL